jgi:hypothetical protein
MAAIEIPRFRGDTKDLVLKLKKDGEIFPLDGSSAILSVSKEKAPELADYVFQSIASIDVAEGSLTFTFSDEDVNVVGKHYYDVQLTDAAGKISTILKGPMPFEQDITK